MVTLIIVVCDTKNLTKKLVEVEIEAQLSLVGVVYSHGDEFKM